MNKSELKELVKQHFNLIEQAEEVSTEETTQEFSEETSLTEDTVVEEAMAEEVIEEEVKMEDTAEEEIKEEMIDEMPKMEEILEVVGEVVTEMMSEIKDEVEIVKAEMGKMKEKMSNFASEPAEEKTYPKKGFEFSKSEKFATAKAERTYNQLLNKLKK